LGRCERGLRLGGDTLSPARGYSTDHPLIDDLKRKDFIASIDLTKRRSRWTLPGRFSCARRADDTSVEISVGSG